MLTAGQALPYLGCWLMASSYPYGAPVSANEHKKEELLGETDSHAVESSILRCGHPRVDLGRRQASFKCMCAKCSSCNYTSQDVRVKKKQKQVSGAYHPRSLWRQRTSGSSKGSPEFPNERRCSHLGRNVIEIC